MNEMPAIILDRHRMASDWEIVTKVSSEFDRHYQVKFNEIKRAEHNFRGYMGLDGGLWDDKDLEKLEKATYIAAVLYTYGLENEGKKKKIDGLIISNFQTQIKQSRSEVIALCFGINRGYSAFSNKYKSGEKETIVKYELASQVDYYTIESIFQFTFFDTISNKFQYLDWIPKLPIKKVESRSDYQILDEKFTSHICKRYNQYYISVSN